MIDQVLTREEADVLGRVIRGMHEPVRERDVKVARVLGEEFHPPLLSTQFRGEVLHVDATPEGVALHERDRASWPRAAS